MTKYVVTYGIACVTDDNEACEPVAEIGNVSVSRREVESIVKLLNENDVSPEHLRDIVDDMISKV